MAEGSTIQAISAMDPAPTAQAPAPLLLNAKQSAEQNLSHRIGPDESLISLTEATRFLPKVNGKRISVCALWRWARRGLRGVRLDYCRVGRRICTSREALLRFFSELAELDERSFPDARSRPRVLKRLPITSKQRERALLEADEILARAKI